MRKYSAYAIGEILLVVIGILIALQINNWNEARREQNEIASFARALASDLEADIAMAEPILVQIRDRRDNAYALAEYVRETPVDQLRNLDLAFFSARMSYYRPYTWNRSALNQLIASGSMRNMKNQDLARRINDYVALTYHLDEDLKSDNEYSGAAADVMILAIDYNYPGRERLMGYNEFPDLEVFRTSELYASLSEWEANASMRAVDTDRLHSAINKYLQVARYLGPRVNFELPELIESAQKLIDTIRAEYPRPGSEPLSPEKARTPGAYRPVQPAAQEENGA
jgi:heme-degrading monooxygenase HmoA